MNNKKAVVLLSGGIDSTTCLAQAVKEYGAESVLALNVFYGQKHDRELQAAVNVADFYGVQYMRQDLTEVFKLSNCTLLKGREDIPHKTYAEQTDGKTPVSTYVPFRNGLFLSYATAIALSVGAHEVWYGAHKDDAAGAAYPDCSYEFADAMDSAISEGTGGKVRLRVPFIHQNKAAIVAEGLELGAPYHLTWSCYEGGNKACGTCGTCRDRLQAFRTNGVIDPIEYEEVKFNEKQ